MECNYTVLGTRHTTIWSPMGQYVGAQEVTFTTPGSGPQRVTIPDSEFTPDRVQAEIEARCEAISSVLNLGK